MKVVQENAAKTNPDKKIYCDSSRGWLRMTIRLVVGTLCQIIRQGLIIIISHRHVWGIVALMGPLVVTA